MCIYIYIYIYTHRYTPNFLKRHTSEDKVYKNRLGLAENNGSQKALLSLCCKGRRAYKVDGGGTKVAHTTMIGRTWVYKKPCSLAAGGRQLRFTKNACTFVVGGGQEFTQNPRVLVLQERKSLQRTLHFCCWKTIRVTEKPCDLCRSRTMKGGRGGRGVLVAKFFVNPCPHPTAKLQ